MLVEHFQPHFRVRLFFILVLANSTKMCYTYDNLNRVTKRTIKNLSNVVLSEETFTYDAAGNVTDASESCFAYDTNNRLVVFNGNNVSYDLDGNMLNNGVKSFTYDSANQLITADGHTYTYNAEGVRSRNLCTEEDTTYTYDTNCKLSKLLTKTTSGITTKYVYGRGLIGEEVSGAFKTYHFDYRGSTVAITDESGNITDTFAYDTYGKLLSRTGTSAVIFCYNGRDGVVTDANGLIYMRARYYSPEMKRFINADVIAGAISSAITLNRFAYANGNPVSFIDPFGLSSQPARDLADYPYAVQVLVNSGEIHWPPSNQEEWELVNETLRKSKDSEGDFLQNQTSQYIQKNEYIQKTTSNKQTTEDIQKNNDVISDVICWFEDAGEWLNRNARNKDGSYALHDNQRFNKDAVFHEQILAFTPSAPSWNWSMEDFSVGLGSLSVDAKTGGWEGENANLSLLDFGHAEAGLELKNGKLNVGAMASIWSPAFSVNIFGVNVELGAEVGAVGLSAKGQFSAGKKEIGFSIGGGVGFSFNVSW